MSSGNLNLMAWDIEKNGLPSDTRVVTAKGERAIQIFQFYRDTMFHLRDTLVGQAMIEYARKELTDVKRTRTLVYVNTAEGQSLMSMRFFGSLYGWMCQHGVFDLVPDPFQSSPVT